MDGCAVDIVMQDWCQNFHFGRCSVDTSPLPCRMLCDLVSLTNTIEVESKVHVFNQYISHCHNERQIHACE